jgi:hypothetical protein
MNSICGKILLDEKTGIFRIDDDDYCNINFNKINNTLNTNTDILSIYDNIRTKYDICKERNTGSMYHSCLKQTGYSHITSPIRRIVDLINITAIQHILKMYSFKNNALQFINDWYSRIDFINEKYRIINKLQNKFNNLDLCINNVNNIMDITHNCFVIDIKHTINDQTKSDNILQNMNKYMLYIPLYKLFVNLETISALILNNEYKCKLFVFYCINKTSPVIKAQLDI